MSFYDILLAKKLEDKRDPQVKGLTVTENGSYSETGTVYNVVNVNLPLDEKTITANGTYNASADNLQGYNKVVVNVAGYKLKDALSGSISTFTDGVDLPLNKLVVGIDSQSGVGECNLVVNGINQWDEEWVQGHVSTRTGDLIETGQKIRSKNYIPVVPNTSYYCIPATGTIGLNYACYDINKTFIVGGEIHESNHFTITIPPNGRYLMISTFGTTVSTYNNDISINYPSTDTSYHAYDGHTYNISFPSGVTISNGSIDILNGVLTDDDLSETYNITPIAIRSLEGVNNVFADTGDIEELEYFTT